MKLITLFSVSLTLLDMTSSTRVIRQTPQDRTMFSRYANSRFPFFTVDMARFQDRNPSTGKRAMIDRDDNNAATVNDITKVEGNEWVGEHNLDGIAEAFGVFDAKHVGNLNLISEEFTGYENVPTLFEAQSAEKRSGIKKRIHTCAFMRRLGVPIGLCFSSMKKLNEANKNKNRQLVQGSRSGESKNPYKYLERQWQGHTMLGGGVGRR